MLLIMMKYNISFYHFNDCISLVKLLKKQKLHNVLKCFLSIG